MEHEPSWRVVGLFSAAGAGLPMASHEEVQVLEGVGIPGDRYATHQGHWSDPRWPDQELTLVEAELLAELGLPLHGLRRNIVTQGSDLSRLIGREFTIGSATLRGVRICTPCRYIEGLTRPGMLADLAGRGGLRATVMGSGTLRVGDEIRLFNPAKG